MKTKLLFIIIALLILAGVFIFLRLPLKLPQIEKELTDLITKEVKERISLPPPLSSAEQNAKKAFLTREGIINQTNAQREKYGLPPLRENKTLNAMAEEKAQDMFNNQYFAHKSPSGVEVDGLAKSFRYEFISLGENLAQGNFENDSILVEAWMGSPGHRANILNEDYQEIGVGVVKGTFEGRTTWMAVQHFGLPLSACPEPNEDLKARIAGNQSEIAILEKILEQIGNSPKTRPLIEEYNRIVLKYNKLADETKNLISQYNAQVKIFNDCANRVE